MSQCTGHACAPNIIPTEDVNNLTEVQGFPDMGIDSCTVPSKIYENNYEPVNNAMAKSMAGGGKKNKKLSLKEIQNLDCNIPTYLKNSKNDPNSKFAKTVSYYQGNCNKKPFVQKGKGSDWMSTQYSMGPVNNQNMSESQFRMFNKSIPVPDMNSYGATRIIPTELKLDQPLYAQNACQEGLSTNKYGGALEPHELFKANEPDYSVPGQNFNSFSNTSIQNGIQNGSGSDDHEEEDDEEDYENLDNLEQIRNPITKKWVSVHSNEGRKVIQKYIEYLNGGKKLCTSGPNVGSYKC